MSDRWHIACRLAGTGGPAASSADSSDEMTKTNLGNDIAPVMESANPVAGAEPSAPPPVSAEDITAL